MTGNTFFGRWFVKKYCLAIYYTAQFVTLDATHIAMCPLERKCGSLVMIEQGWFPAGAVVAVCAVRSAARSGELCAMNVGVAVLALLGRSMEIHVHQLGLKVRRFVAVNAGYGAVCPDQCERGLRMVKSR